MEEEIIWSGKTSHVRYLFTYSIMFCTALLIYFKAHGYYRCLILVPAIWIMWNYLSIELSSITITNQRLIIKHGIINHYLEEIELFRIKDISIYTPIAYRLNSCANLIFVTSDKTTPNIVLIAIHGATVVKDLI